MTELLYQNQFILCGNGDDIHPIRTIHYIEVALHPIARAATPHRTELEDTKIAQGVGPQIGPRADLTAGISKTHACESVVGA